MNIEIQPASFEDKSILRNLLELYEYDSTEFESCDGETYQIPVEPIIDIPTYELFRTEWKTKKTNSPQQIRHDYLLSGHLKCSCNLTWQARTTTHRRSRSGEWIERKTPIGTYFCPQLHKELRHYTCPKTISAKQAESQVWEKVIQFITNLHYLLAQAKSKVAQLHKRYKQMQQEELQLQEEIKKLNAERQEFITKARKERMPDEEFIPQIKTHYDRELGVQSRLTAIEQEKDAFSKLDLEEQIEKYVADLQLEMVELINANPQNQRRDIRCFC